MPTNPMYHRHAVDYAKAVASNVFNARYERPSLLALVPGVEGLRVLDAGCGSGEHLLELVQRGAVGSGFDQSAEMIEIAKEKFQQAGVAAELFVHDLQSPLERFEEGRFDLVISALALHYVENLEPVFQEFSRLLRPGGSLCCSTHHPMIDFEDPQAKNYFACELLTQEWDTIGDPVTVQFYRRPLSQFLNAAFAAGFQLNGVSEGKPDEGLKMESPELYERLTTQPGFLFLRFVKV
ncbi:class I SAM-dependent methyltransferase [Calycomorphotria hydatis]|uniref:C-methyltransferase CouO n=1 Tax=Calycomorphotria hydatis TaxID=2528027 RepID=A0A517T734_9PLAN|nr:class I SAM-dependent methyltransferase [Calycomorphotria hydatis]QDT64188.1 C-methyltransferase CouO [Calycomorphotria hydatis]